MGDSIGSVISGETTGANEPASGLIVVALSISASPVWSSNVAKRAGGAVPISLRNVFWTSSGAAA